MRLRTMIMFGIGYLIGSRAGSDRYQQVAGSVRDLAESDVVRDYADRAFSLARNSLQSRRGEDEDVSADEQDTTEDTAEEASEPDSETGEPAERSTQRRSRGKRRPSRR